MKSGKLFARIVSSLERKRIRNFLMKKFFSKIWDVLMDDDPVLKIAALLIFCLIMLVYVAIIDFR